MCRQTLRAAVFPRSFAISVWLCSLAAAGGPAWAADGLKITVVEGQGAINNVRTRNARDPVVEIRDETNRPVAGATVTFQTPATGPSALFEAGHVLITQTDASGRAVGRGLRPNATGGPFDIRVTVSYGSEMASDLIRQVNAAPAEPKSSRKVLWVGLIAGAAAGGVIAATHGGSSNAAASPTTTSSGGAVAGSVLVAGSSTFGPPR